MLIKKYLLKVKDNFNSEKEIKSLKVLIGAFVWIVSFFSVLTFLESKSFETTDGIECLMFGLLVNIAGLIGFVIKEPIIIFGFGQDITDWLNKRNITFYLNRGLLVIGTLLIVAFGVIQFISA